MMQGEYAKQWTEIAPSFLSGEGELELEMDEGI
jgi:hypothetical protein